MASLWSNILPMDSSKLRVSAAYIRNNAAALQIALSKATLGDMMNPAVPYIPTTAPIWFYADVAPTGWDLNMATGDALLAVKGGASQYNATGGNQVGTWNGPAVALTATQLPTNIPADRGTATGTYPAVSNVSSQFITLGGTAGQTHEHNYTATRPFANLGIICAKHYP